MFKMYFCCLHDHMLFSQLISRLLIITLFLKSVHKLLVIIITVTTTNNNINSYTFRPDAILFILMNKQSGSILSELTRRSHHKHTQTKETTMQHIHVSQLDAPCYIPHTNTNIHTHTHISNKRIHVFATLTAAAALKPTACFP